MTVQIPVRIPDEDARALDDAIARGRFTSRSDAMRAGLARVLREERDREIAEQYRVAYEKCPQEDWIGENGLALFAAWAEAEGRGQEPL